MFYPAVHYLIWGPRSISARVQILLQRHAGRTSTAGCWRTLLAPRVLYKNTWQNEAIIVIIFQGIDHKIDSYGSCFWTIWLTRDPFLWLHVKPQLQRSASMTRPHFSLEMHTHSTVANLSPTHLNNGEAEQKSVVCDVRSTVKQT